MQKELTDCAEIYFDPSLVCLIGCFDLVGIADWCSIEPFATHAPLRADRQASGWASGDSETMHPAVRY